jgi:hypothetical protein
VSTAVALNVLNHSVNRITSTIELVAQPLPPPSPSTAPAAPDCAQQRMEDFAHAEALDDGLTVL